MKGYIDTGYFPIMLCKAFIISCPFGGVVNKGLLDSFSNFVSISDAILMETALSTNDQSIYTDDEFSELMERFDCRSYLPIFVELARQELVRKPFLMVSTWRDILSLLKANGNFQSIISLRKFYEKVEPTNTKSSLCFGVWNHRRKMLNVRSISI